MILQIKCTYSYLKVTSYNSRSRCAQLEHNCHNTENQIVPRATRAGASPSRSPANRGRRSRPSASPDKSGVHGDGDGDRSGCPDGGLRVPATWAGTGVRAGDSEPAPGWRGRPIPVARQCAEQARRLVPVPACWQQLCAAAGTKPPPRVCTRGLCHVCAKRPNVTRPAR